MYIVQWLCTQKALHRKSLKKSQNRFEFTRMNVKSLIYCLYLILSILLGTNDNPQVSPDITTNGTKSCCFSTEMFAMNGWMNEWMRTREILSFLFRCLHHRVSVLFVCLYACVCVCVSLSAYFQSVLVVAFCLCSIAICIRRKFGSFTLAAFFFWFAVLCRCVAVPLIFICMTFTKMSNAY